MLALLRQLCYYNKAFWNNISESRIADVAELADAHGSGPCESNFMQVQVLSSAPVRVFIWTLGFFICKCRYEHPHYVAASFISLAAIFLQKSPARSFRSFFFCKRSRLLRLLACKRAHNAFIALPTFCGRACGAWRAFKSYNFTPTKAFKPEPFTNR